MGDSCNDATTLTFEDLSHWTEQVRNTLLDAEVNKGCDLWESTIFKKTDFFFLNEIIDAEFDCKTQWLRKNTSVLQNT